MEIASNARVPTLSSVPDAPRPVPVSQPAAVKTELPPDASVQQAPRSEAPLSDNRPPLAADFLDRSLTVDLETRKIVFQAIDERTGDVVVQYPDPRYLKAYADQLRQSGAADAQELIGRLA